MDDARIAQLAELFRALADPTRLRILGALAERPHSGRELSERLRLTPPTISHHMARLADVGVVRVTAEAQRRIYSLNETLLREVARETRAADPADASGVAMAGAGDHLSAEDRDRSKVLRDFFVGERLKQIPAQRKKRVIVLQHLLTRFEPGRAYPEREVNDRLRTAHEDVATLRRELVDYGFMTRQSGVYRVAASPPARGPTVAQEIIGDEGAWLRGLVAGATQRALGTADGEEE